MKCGVSTQEKYQVYDLNAALNIASTVLYILYILYKYRIYFCTESASKPYTLKVRRL